MCFFWKKEDPMTRGWKEKEPVKLNKASGNGMTGQQGVFYIDWYQGFEDEKYVRTMTELLQKAGMKSAAFERVE